jgi:hypothetical protein
MEQPVRRVVTGHDAEGKAIVSSDGAPTPWWAASAPGAEDFVELASKARGMGFTGAFCVRPAQIEYSSPRLRTHGSGTARCAGGTQRGA